MGASDRRIRSGGDLYRFLQEHKTDDLAFLGRAVDERFRECRTRGDERPHVLDLGAGLGRTVHLYPPEKWRVTCVDADLTALDELVRARPDIAVRCEWLPAIDAWLDPADLVICAHHVANELDDPGALIELASRNLREGGVLLLDLVVGREHYPASHCREGVRVLQAGGERWLLETVVVPGPRVEVHTLMLLGTLCDSTDPEAPRRVARAVPRRVPRPEDVLTRAAAGWARAGALGAARSPRLPSSRRPRHTAVRVATGAWWTAPHDGL